MFDENALTWTDTQGNEGERPDWALLRSGPVTLFRNPNILADSVAWLERHGYIVAQINCADCDSEEEALWAIGDPLDFPHWPAPTLSRFNDDCRQLPIAQEGGRAVVLHRLDLLAERFPDFVTDVLDTLSRASWHHLLFGRRLLCLVRSEDPWIEFGPIGGWEPCWNDREWFHEDRLSGI